MREFKLGQVLSVIGEKLVCEVEEVYEILSYMTGESVFTHQLPRFARECKPWLLRQHPQLATVDDSSVTSENWSQWLDEQIKKFGATLKVEPIPADDHDRKNPIAELVEMCGADRVIVVDPESLSDPSASA